MPRASDPYQARPESAGNKLGLLGRNGCPTDNLMVEGREVQYLQLVQAGQMSYVGPRRRYPTLHKDHYCWRYEWPSSGLRVP